jgi:hypothetical protein
MVISRGNSRLQRHESHMKLASAWLSKLEMLTPYSLVAGYRQFRGTYCLPAFVVSAFGARCYKRVTVVTRIRPGTEHPSLCLRDTMT